MIKKIIPTTIIMLLMIITIISFALALANAKEPEFCIITINGQQYTELCEKSNNDKLIITKENR